MAFYLKEEEEKEDKERNHNCILYSVLLTDGSFILTGSKRDIEDRIVARSVDADDSDVEVKSDDDRFIIFQFGMNFMFNCLKC